MIPKALSRHFVGLMTLGPALVAALTIDASSHQASAQSNAQVTISGFSFSPGTLTIAPGTTVTWTHAQPGVSHTVTSDPSSTVQWNSGILQSGQSFSFTFTQPGTYTYHCQIHASMHGAIVVQANTPSTETLSPTMTSTVSPTAVPNLYYTATDTPVPTATASLTPTATVIAENTATPTPTPSPTSSPTSTPSATATRTPVPDAPATPPATAIPPTPTSTPTPTHRGNKTILTTEKNHVFLFSIKSTTVRIGTRVIWKNTTHAQHSVTSTSSTWKFDKQLAPGKSVSYRFTKAGTYHYRCKYHPGMKATIIVKR